MYGRPPMGPPAEMWGYRPPFDMPFDPRWGRGMPPPFMPPPPDFRIPVNLCVLDLCFCIFMLSCTVCPKKVSPLNILQQQPPTCTDLNEVLHTQDDKFHKNPLLHLRDFQFFQTAVTNLSYRYDCFLADIICDFFTFQQDSAPAHRACANVS